jgi:uroporphyrinogen-III decarboxylase
MAEITPRRAIRAVLKGELPSQPLLMPILFSLGSRLENIAMRDFLSNPTKITNALRQIRSVLKVDGLACYFDPFLEAEALGCKLNWAPDGPSGLVCPQFSDAEELRQKLCSPDKLEKMGRIPIASQVLQRLKVMLKDEPALMVAVSGPFTLAAQLAAGSGSDNSLLVPDLVEFAAEVTAQVAQTFVEAGADVVFLMESATRDLSPEMYDSWASWLDPVINVIRFYEALPVLLLNNSTRDFPPAIFSRDWNCVLCAVRPDAEVLSDDMRKPPGRGVVLPTRVFSGERSDFEALVRPASRFAQNPIFLTSPEDIPASADLKQLAHVLDTIRGLFSQVV